MMRYFFRAFTAAIPCVFLAACGHSEHREESLALLNESGSPLIGIDQIDDTFTPNPAREASITLQETWPTTYTHWTNIQLNPLQPTSLRRILFSPRTPLCAFLASELTQRAPTQKVSLRGKTDSFYSATIIVDRVQLDRYLAACPPSYNQDIVTLLSIVNGYDEEVSTDRTVKHGARILLFPVALALSFVGGLNIYNTAEGRTALSLSSDGKIRAIDGDEHNSRRHKEVVEETRSERVCDTRYDSDGKRTEDCHYEDKTYSVTVYY